MSEEPSNIVKMTDVANIPLFSEFDPPMGQLLARATNCFMEGEFPLLGEIERETVASFSEKPSQRVGKGFSSGLKKSTAEAVLGFSDILETNVEAWSALAYEVGLQLGGQMMNVLVSTLEQVTKETGNVVSAGGGKLSHDLLLDTLERLEFRVDDEGSPQGLVLLGGPGFSEHVAKLPPMTTEQETRFRRILQQKYEAQNAKKRTRTLD